MNTALLWPSLSAAIAAGSAIALLRRTATPGYPGSAQRQALPPGLRWLWRPAQHLHLLVDRHLPQRLRVHLTRRLARAGLLDTLDAAGWSALLCAWLIIAAVILALDASWTGSMHGALFIGALLACWLSQSWLQARAARRASRLVKDLPAAIDLLVLCLESGASLGTALRLTHDKAASGPLQDLFANLLQQIRAGRGRTAAFRQVIDQFDLPAVTGVMTALIQADARGMSLGPILRAQSAQCIAERFVRAERAALQAPVKLLMPLLLCIFPCTFIVIAVPIAARLTSQGGP